MVLDMVRRSTADIVKNHLHLEELRPGKDTGGCTSEYRNQTNIYT